MKKILLVMIIGFVLISCNKEDTVTNQSVQTESLTDYFPMTNGSYWVYKMYTADSTLVFTEQTAIDSVVIIKDSLLNGHQYKVFRSTFRGDLLRRDSAGIIVNENGLRLFTLKTDLKYLEDWYLPAEDSEYHYTSKLASADSIFSVPSGSYNTKHVNGAIERKYASPPSMKMRYFKYAYAKGIGLVYSRIVYSFDASYVEAKLIKYQIK